MKRVTASLVVSLLACPTLARAAIEPVIVSSFTVPAGQALALTWGDGSLWLADQNRVIYRLSPAGDVEATLPHSIFSLTDLSWHENSLWAHNGSQVYRLDASAQIVETLDVGYWAFSGMEWAEGELYVGDYNFGDIHKHDRSGNHIFSWATNFFGHPEDMV